MSGLVVVVVIEQPDDLGRLAETGLFLRLAFEGRPASSASAIKHTYRSSADSK